MIYDRFDIAFAHSVSEHVCAIGSADDCESTLGIEEPIGLQRALVPQP